MITELEIEGFKSFGSPPERLKPGALNFVVGANASGKTNLLSALRFLQNAVMQNVEYAVNDLGGSMEVLNRILRQRHEPKPVRFRIKMQTETEFELPAGKIWKATSFDYDIALNLRGEANAPLIERESLTAEVIQDAKNHRFTLRRDTAKVVINDPTLPNSGKVEIPVPLQEGARLAVGVGFFTIPCVILREEISRWRFYNIIPKIARQPYREGPETDLGLAGEHLAVILHDMEQDQEGRCIEAIVSGLRGAVPGFKGIKTTQLPVEGTWAFQVLEERIRGAMNPASISDGTIRLLALLVITTWVARHSSLIAIEEPENGLHPHLAEYVVNILRDASKQRQFVITTHNPTFLDYLKPDEVILCDKKEGFTQLRHASDIAEIDEFRKHFSLGELWVQGTLGGIP